MENSHLNYKKETNIIIKQNNIITENSELHIYIRKKREK